MGIFSFFAACDICATEFGGSRGGPLRHALRIRRQKKTFVAHQCGQQIDLLKQKAQENIKKRKEPQAESGNQIGDANTRFKASILAR